jgi:DNA ligase (NAD+)
VVKINDLKLSDSLGFQNGRPLAQVAYKFPSQSLETKIVDITWQVGPLGTVTPVAQVEPIEVAGAVITYASLANHDLIIEKNLNIGDIVELSRRGDVIPYVEKVVVKVTPGHLSPPTSCPSCASALIKDNKYLRCKNKSCPAQILGQLNLFCKVLDIKNISDKTIKKLKFSSVEKNILDKYPFLFPPRSIFA